MTNKYYVYFLAIALTALFLSSCSSTKITADYDKSVDFTKYKSFEYYGWAKESDKLLNDLDKKRIEESFANEFYKRGLTYVKEGGDLIVTLFIVVEQKTQTTANTTSMGGYGHFGGYYGYGPGYGWGPSYSTTTVSTYDYQVGTLVCDVYDKTTEQLIWEGIASKTIDENPQSRDKNIPKVIQYLMKKYPVPPVETSK
ncbi:MAG: DUF4136 domain-containing protein [Bacteroidales bacterium]